jgi:hypothetical protein
MTNGKWKMPDVSAPRRTIFHPPSAIFHLSSCISALRAKIIFYLSFSITAPLLSPQKSGEAGDLL